MSDRRLADSSPSLTESAKSPAGRGIQADSKVESRMRCLRWLSSRQERPLAGPSRQGSPPGYMGGPCQVYGLPGIPAPLASGPHNGGVPDQEVNGSESAALVQHRVPGTGNPRSGASVREALRGPDLPDTVTRMTDAGAGMLPARKYVASRARERWPAGRWHRWELAARVAESRCRGHAGFGPFQLFAVRVLAPGGHCPADAAVFACCQPQARLGRLRRGPACTQ